MNTTVTTPTSADRQLLAGVNRWRRTHGWTLSHRGWVNASYAGAATIAVNYDEHRDGFTLAHRGDRIGTWPLFPPFYPADSVRQAVDLLVALDILPARFSSAYKTGWHDGFFHTVEDETHDEVDGYRLRIVPRVLHDVLCAWRVATPQETDPVVLGCAGCGLCYPREGATR